MIRKTCTVLSTLALATSSTVWAQDAKSQNPGGASDETTSLGEIVVTAQRREERLQDVPIAVTALGTADIERKQIRDTLDLIQHVPNLIGNNNVGLGSSNTYYIRGVGNTESIATQDVPVGTYVDDVYISRQNANNFGLFDVERIEVLRGPQGTLFGRNTTGGAINIVMKKPGNQLGGYFEGGTGSYDARDFRGSVDLPVSGAVLTKFSAFRHRDDGYARQLSTGDMLNGLDTWGARAAVRLLPGEDFIVDLTGDLVDDTNANLLNGVDPATGDRIVHTGIVKDALAGYFIGSKRFNSPGNEARTWSTSANLQWLIGELTLSSISGYRNTHQLYFIDSISGAPNPIPTGVSPILNDSAHEQWSQEFKATGKTLDNALNYVFGLYYLHENNHTDLGTGVGSATRFSVTGDRTIANTLDSYAAYAQTDYRFAGNFTATLGVRYTDETKKLDVYKNAGGLGPVFSSALIAAAGIPLQLDARFLTPRFALAYQYSPEVMFYTSATRGAKSGGWNGRALANNLFLPFSPEKVWSEEIGMRSELFDRRLRLNVTGFYAYTQDVQISAAYTVNNTRIFTTTNPADLRNYGGEIEATWMPTRKLTLEAMVGLQNARYTNISSAVETQIAQCQAALSAHNAGGIAANCNRGFVDFAGRIATPVRAPDVSVVASATYAFDTPVVSIRPNVDLNYNDGYAIGNAGNPDSTDGAWTGSQVLWNASVAFDPAALPNLSLTVDCKNCSDRTYSVSFLSATSIYLNPPRTWDVHVRYQF
jgi:iron complex outermembrane recepter protein